MVGPRHQVRPRASPLVSVVIATFNWSAALRLAIASVLRQTLDDFEILVVGDACTDDSAAVVAAFADPRITWLNLAENAGGQQGPNNAGLARARGRWIAYLGHDDIWAPRHLAATLAAADAAGTEVAAGGMIMYGPPGSGVLSTAGLFDPGGCSERDFVPPSALIHSRALIERIGPWKDPRTLRLPVDCDLFQRARGASPVASSGEITVFKFNATARRNAYQIKPTAEQEACLAGLERGERFIEEERAKVAAAAATGLWTPIVMPNADDDEPGAVFRRNRIAKGVEPRFAADQLRSLGQIERFSLDAETPSYEWYPLEFHPSFGSFRWTAPSERSTIELPVRLDQPLSVTVHLLSAIAEQSLKDLVLEAQGAPIETRIERTAAGTWLVRGLIDPARRVSPVAYVQLALRGVTAARPVDLGVHADHRRLGVAVSWVEIGPVG